MVSPSRSLCAVFVAGLAFVQSAPQSESPVEAKLESRIYFARQLDGDRGRSILSVRPDGTGERVEVAYKSGMGENNPAPSPDGSYLLFNTYRYGGWKIAKKAGQDAVERWTLGADYYTNPAFDTKGTRVAFGHTSRSGTDISVRTLSTSDEAAWASTKAHDERVPVWTPDGGLVSFDGRSGKQQIYLQPTKDAETKLLSDGQGNDFAPAMSPDGQRVAFYSDRTGHADLMVLDLKTNELHNLTADIRNETTPYVFGERTYWRLKVAWSPDGGELVFLSPRDGNYELFVVRPDGTGLRRLTTTAASEITPAWGLGYAEPVSAPKADK